MTLEARSPHSQTPEELFHALQTSAAGLSRAEARSRLDAWGPNRLPSAPPPGILAVFFRQFIDPLILGLLVVAAMSIFLKHFSDAGFIAGILLMNAVIGAFQEFHAEMSALALRKIVSTHAIVERDGESYEIPSEEVVIGDLVYIESGTLIPADLRLLSTQGLLVDESLLTGESVPVHKNHAAEIPDDAPVADRANMGFAGTLITRGRGEGIVVGTATRTELGKIASAVLKRVSTKTPLLIRMERFTRTLGLVLVLIVVIMGAFLIHRGGPFTDVLLLSIALGVSAIPEGLPIALTVALSVASRRMARRKVIVRHLAAVEALGSCTIIGTDKTGTLTINELTVRKVFIPGAPPIEISGTGIVPEGELRIPPQGSTEGFVSARALARAAALCNEATLSRRDGEWVAHGDAVDVALLVMAHKAGITAGQLFPEYHLVSEIPFESEHRFSATQHRAPSGYLISTKGALETLLPMCTRMRTSSGEAPLDKSLIEEQAIELAQAGFRVLALASRTDEKPVPEALEMKHLTGLTFLGLVAMIDPLRPEAKAAIQDSQKAGVAVAMITGDHPVTALAIARELGLAQSLPEVVTGKALKAEKNQEALDRLIRDGKVFARVEPQQKLDIVQSLIRQNRFVAVTGDGVNDAPALKAAHVGVAMGKTGTDVARETADLIITDDRFSSIVAGIEEGRIAYSNLRKVIYLLVSTSAAEIVLFLLTIFAGLPMPLTAVQLLWLNLVTDGIQVIALAFEPGEGDELSRPPRPPRESIFNRLMIERVGISSAAMGCLAFMTYKNLLSSGLEPNHATNRVLLLMVLFENILIGNARSESRSTFLLSPFRNTFLLFATLGAPALHVAAMHIPFFQRVLGVEPLSLAEWLRLLALALIVLFIGELHKALRSRFPLR